MRWLPFTTLTVQGESMAPTMRHGQRWLVRRAAGRTPPTGRIIVFATPAAVGGGDLQWMVKRVVAGPGDPVPAEVADRWGGGRVPRRCVVVRGDNPVSQDSRHFGYVEAASVLGVVIRRLG